MQHLKKRRFVWPLKTKFLMLLAAFIFLAFILFILNKPENINAKNIPSTDELKTVLTSDGKKNMRDTDFHLLEKDPCTAQALKSPFASTVLDEDLALACEKISRNKSDSEQLNSVEALERMAVPDMPWLWNRMMAGDKELAMLILMEHAHCTDMLNSPNRIAESEQCHLEESKLDYVLKNIQTQADKGSAKAVMSLALWKVRSAKSQSELSEIKNLIKNISQEDFFDEFQLLDLDNKITN